MGKITYNDKVKINELPDVPAINKVRDVDMNEIKTSANDLYDALGLGTDTFSTSTSYVVGDLVIYNGMIYKCITATSGAWNPANWSLVPIFVDANINDEIKEMLFENEHSDSTTEGYSANYVNNQISSLKSMGKTVTLNNEWRNAFKPTAGNLTTVIPIKNPTRTAPTLNITSAEVYIGGWTSCTVAIQGVTETQVDVRLTPPSGTSLTDGNVYLCRLVGSITAR